ncbi:hypothetical protein [Streptomyces sp. NPDC005876]|jgi:hypothetical protein|uniref:hypothetical protein n=1 Tax=unclassified Streptomyces TaxID=2593676 RepID=UPI0033F72B9B
MIQWNEENEREQSLRAPLHLAMPRQAPPVQRTRSSSAPTDDTSGVQANFNLGDFLKNVLI